MIIDSQRSRAPKWPTISAGSSWIISLAVYCILQPGVALSEWRFDPVLRGAWDYDDNANLSGRTDAELELSGYIAEASVDVIYNSERGRMAVRPMLRSRNYGESNKDQNSDDQFLRFSSISEGDKNTLRIAADFNRESVRTAELADASIDTDVDPDDIADDQSGFVNVRERRERYRIAPRWSYRFSNVSSFDTELSYLLVNYEEQQEPVNLFDFNDTRLRFGYRRNFSQRNNGSITLTARTFDTDRLAGDRDTFALTAGFVRRVSETTQFRAQLGVESVRREDIDGSTIDRDPQPVVDLSLIRRLKTVRLLAQYRQRVNGTGRGLLTRRNELNLRFSRDLTDRFSAGLGVRGYSDNTISGSAREQNYIQLRGQVVWRLSRSFSLQGDYRHTVIDRDTIEGAADSNRLTIWLSYQPSPVRRDPRLGVRF
jgi:hypothetical protein